MNKLKDVIEAFNLYADEIGCMTNDDGYMGSHKIVSTLRITDTDGNSYELVDVSIDYLGGCGCPSDITMEIKRYE